MRFNAISSGVTSFRRRVPVAAAVAAIQQETPQLESEGYPHEPALARPPVAAWTGGPHCLAFVKPAAAQSLPNDPGLLVPAGGNS